MIPIRLWARNTGVAAGLIALAILWFYYRSQPVNSTSYAPRTMALALSGTFLAMVIAAAFGAWEAVRITRFHQTRPNIQRSPSVMVVFTILPTIAGSTFAILIIVWLRVSEEFIRDPSVWGMLIAGLAAIIGAALFGLCMGIVIPSYLAAPLAGAILYGILILQALFLDDRLSVLAARFDECCDNSQVIDPKAILSSVAFAVGMAGLAIMLAGFIWIGRRPRLFHITLPITILAIVLSIWWPLNLDAANATTDRKGTLACAVSAASRIQYCVWPEHEQNLSALVTSGDQAFQLWQQTPITIPTSVTELGARLAPPNSVVIGLRASVSHDDIVFAIASGIVGEPSSCYLSFQGIQPYPYLMAWLLTSAGTTEDSNILRQFSFPGSPGNPGPLAFAQLLEQSSRQIQNNWLEGALAANRDCNVDFSLNLS